MDLGVYLKKLSSKALSKGDTWSDLGFRKILPVTCQEWVGGIKPRGKEVRGLNNPVDDKGQPRIVAHEQELEEASSNQL